MNNKLMKLTALLLMVFMLPIFSAFAETTPDTPTAQMPETSVSDTDAPVTDTPEDPTWQVPSPTGHRDSILGYYLTNTTLTNWWDVIALYGAGEDLTNYTLPQWTTESLGETATVTDYAGIIFGLIATGENVHNIWGRDIADELAKKQDKSTGLFGAYPNQQIYSMLALDAANEPYDREAALTALTDTFRTADGAFGYLPFDPTADPVITPDIDITALALLVLDEAEHADIINSAVTYLAGQQLENGGFASWGTENSNTLETVIYALATHNLLTDSRFIKNNRSLSDVLSDYILDNGMLAWESGDTEENLMATQQGLIAYGDIISGNSVFLRLSSAQVCSTINANVRIEGSAYNVLNCSVSVKGYDLNLVDAIKSALDKNSIPYIIEDSDYGAYIKSINLEAAGKFGGWDGWLVTVNGSSLSGSADSVLLQEGDEILVYYGMFEPGTLIPQYTLSTSEFVQGTPFIVTVNASYFDYTTSQQVTTPIVGATVEVGGAKFITNSEGLATVTPATSGNLTVKIYKENENSYPSIVRIEPFEINVAAAYYGGGGGSYTPPAKEEQENPQPEEETKPETEPTPEIELTYADTDEISDWAVEGVKKAVQAGLFEGDDAGRINPHDNLSRAELATVLLRLVGADETYSDAKFSDISPDDWFYKAICTVCELGLMNGIGGGVFAPGESVTREQAAVVIARVLNLDSAESADYADSEEISDWAIDAINALTKSGIMEGSDGRFNPGDILTREMCAVIMVRALEFIAQ